ncbi:MAG: hypothetical protein AAGJ83_08295 [Planctomycetota bacterium]
MIGSVVSASVTATREMIERVLSGTGHHYRGFIEWALARTFQN